MKPLSFQVRPARHSKRERLLELDGVTFPAKVRLTLRMNMNEPKEVYVISGPQFRGRLSPEQARILDAFSQRLIIYRDKNRRSEVAAWKTSLERLSEAEVVAWDYGPIPVIQVGHLGPTPVCVTPAPPPRAQLTLEVNHAADEAIILKNLQPHLQACFKEYLADIADLLKGAFLRNKKHALEVCRKAEQILERSIVSKLDLIGKSKAIEEGEKIREAIWQAQELEISVVNAAVVVIKAAIGALRWTMGEKMDPGALVDAAYSQLSSLPDHTPEKAALIKCVTLLERKPDSDELSPIGDDAGASPEWLDDLTLACRLISEARNLIGLHGAHPLFIFVSHHMAVYASDCFYKVVEEYISNSFGGKVLAWTGTGRQTHIQFAILVKIWLSDIQILYIPNSLDTTIGGAKLLKTDSDWVIEEIYYGATIEKDFHVVQAVGADSSLSNVREQFLRQLQSFQWENLSQVFSNLRVPLSRNEFKILGTQLPGKIKEHLKDRIYSLHHPKVSHLIKDDQQQFMRGFIQSGLKKKFDSMLWGLRLGVQADHWLVLQALIQAADNQFHVAQSREVTVDEIQGQLRSRSRSDGGAFTSDWIQRILREQLKLRSLNILTKSVPLIAEGARRSRRKTYKFTLTEAVDAFIEAYNLSILKSDLQKIFWDAIKRPIGAHYAEFRHI